MIVFKFGGASINSAERIKNAAHILKQYPQEKILVVISAMGKTTNALEKVARAFYDGKKEEALQLFQQIKNQHQATANYLLVTQALSCEKQWNSFFTEAEWLLHDKPVRDFDYYYDQIVCIGELLSTSLVSHYLNETGIPNQWLDVRDVFRTDDNFRDAAIDWEFTAAKVTNTVLPLFEKSNLVITQGFIGATDENESTTLGREGSDYTAAVFAHMLNAESLSIWKDVPGIMNADPKFFPQAQPLPQLNYLEVIEMAYYGAQVIHPKTIKPLQNKNIPLYVKCFLDPALPGTVIQEQLVKDLPPIIVYKEKQVMMELRSKDFSFIEEKPVAQLFGLFEKIKIKPNLTQNGAITMICVFDELEEKIEKLALDAAATFDVQLMKGLTLLTIRHYNVEICNKLIGSKEILMQQRTTETMQTLMK
jgi:aspartate kinase